METNAGFEGLAMGNVRRVLEGGEALTAVNKGEVEGWRERGGVAQGGGGTSGMERVVSRGEEGCD